MFLMVLRVKMSLLWQTPKYVLGILTMVREYVRYLSFCAIICYLYTFPVAGGWVVGDGNYQD